MSYKTHLIAIIDESGSMYELKKDTIGGFNSLIEKQKAEKDNDTSVSVVFFNSEVKEICKNKKIGDVKLLKDKDYVPGGCTALLDAIGITLSKDYEVENDTKTLVVIMTDGYENSSKEYSYDTIKKIINEKKKDGYEFIFMGANIDAIGEADKFGIAHENAINYKNDSKGVKANYRAVGVAMKTLKAKGKVDCEWRSEIE